MHARDGDNPLDDDAVSRLTNETFFDVLRTLASAGLTVVAEAAFQDPEIDWLRRRCHAILLMFPQKTVEPGRVRPQPGSEYIRAP